jgi:hypothetical protein
MPLGDEAPVKKKKKANAAGPNSKKMLIIGGSIGGAILLLSCCCLGGLGLWWFFLSGPGDPEQLIIGKWEMTLDNPGVTESTKPTIEFKKDGDYIETGFGLAPSGRWKTVSKSGNIIKVDVTLDQVAGKTSILHHEITVTSSNRLEIHTGTHIKQKYKRVS